MRSPRALLLALVVLFAAGNLWVTFHRSGIPVELTGRVERIEVRREKHPGRDDVHLVTIGGRAVHLEAAVAGRLRAGDAVRKDAWSTTLATPRGFAVLALPLDFRRMLVVMPLILALALLLLRREWGSVTPA